MRFLRAVMFAVAVIRTRSDKQLFRSALAYSPFTTHGQSNRYPEHQL
jgi:hypothetical protein